MKRNKLPYIFIVFVFAGLFICGIICERFRFRYSKEMYWSGQIGMGISILVFMLVPDRKKDKSDLI